MSQTLTSKIQPVYPTQPLFPLSVAQYHAMIENGVLTEDDPAELIEGVLVFQTPKNPPHAFVVKEIEEAVEKLLPRGWNYRTQEPITLDDGEPEPDGLICRGTRRDYVQRHPSPTNTAVIIEVSDTTLSRDRGMKLRSYARAGIPVYWIVNLEARTVEVYEQPDASAAEPTYAAQRIAGEADTLPLMLDGTQVGTLNVRDLLP